MGAGLIQCVGEREGSEAARVGVGGRQVLLVGGLGAVVNVDIPVGILTTEGLVESGPTKKINLTIFLHQWIVESECSRFS